MGVFAMERPSSLRRQLEERLHAQKLLGLLAIQEPHAKAWEEQAAVRSTLSRERAFWHDRLAIAFEDSIGVAPDRREELRSALEELVLSGVGNVEQILADVNTHQVNGDSGIASAGAEA
jgi:phage-related minor tail protein